jgi:hypothetical protein
MGVAMPARSRTSYFTKRGQHFGNLWAVYSYRADRVLLLASDRQLAHWLLKLEFSPSIEHFIFEPSGKEFNDYPGFRLNFHAEIVPIEGNNQLHYLQVEGHTETYQEKKRIAKQYRYDYVEFNDSDWLPDRNKILPLLKVSSFLAGSRKLYVSPAMWERALSYIRALHGGNLRGFLSALQEYDQNLALVVFVRLFSDRLILVSFEYSLFARDTQWRLNEV